MKHLKSYQLFESVKLDYNLIQDIKDILLPLSDIGVEVSCDYLEGGEDISFNLMTSKEKAFNINDYRSDFDALISFMKERGWFIWKFSLGVAVKEETWAGFQLVAKTQNILSTTYRTLIYDVVEDPVFWVSGQFKKGTVK